MQHIQYLLLLFSPLAIVGQKKKILFGLLADYSDNPVQMWLLPITNFVMGVRVRWIFICIY